MSKTAIESSSRATAPSVAASLPPRFSRRETALLATALVLGLLAAGVGGLAIGAYFKALPQGWEMLQQLDKLKGWSFVMGGAGAGLVASSLTFLFWRMCKSPSPAPVALGAPTLDKIPPTPSSTSSPAAPPAAPAPAAPLLPSLSDADLEKACGFIKESAADEALALLQGKAISEQQGSALLSSAIACRSEPSSMIAALRKLQIKPQKAHYEQARRSPFESDRAFCEAIGILCRETVAEVCRMIKEGRNQEVDPLLKDLFIHETEQCEFLATALESGNEEMATRFYSATFPPPYYQILLNAAIEGSSVTRITQLLDAAQNPDVNELYRKALMRQPRDEAVLQLLRSRGAIDPSVKEAEQKATIEAMNAAINARDESEVRRLCDEIERLQCDPLQIVMLAINKPKAEYDEGIARLLCSKFSKPSIISIIFSKAAEHDRPELISATHLNAGAAAFWLGVVGGPIDKCYPKGILALLEKGALATFAHYTQAKKKGLDRNILEKISESITREPSHFTKKVEAAFQNDESLNDLTGWLQDITPNAEQLEILRTKLEDRQSHSAPSEALEQFRAMLGAATHAQRKAARGSS